MADTPSPAMESDAVIRGAHSALAAGDPLLAYDACRSALQDDPRNPRLRQLQALALARSGAEEEAKDILEQLLEEGVRNEETLGMLARVHKDRWRRSRQSQLARGDLARSLSLYQDAYRTAGGHWSGINVATLSLIAGNEDEAKRVATHLRAQCAAANDKWSLATLAEACLLLGDMDDAARAYKQALAAGAADGDRAPMRRNARLIFEAKGIDGHWLESVLPAPLIGVFTGHMPDAPLRPTTRFPTELTRGIGDAIRARLREDNIRIGYASAAAGSDILFHEALADISAESRVILPSPPEIFVQTSVQFAGDEWVARFQAVLNRASAVVVHSESTAGDIAFAYNNWMMLGLARSHARAVDGHIRSFAVWDGKETGLGGTSSAIRDWRGFGEDVHWIAPNRPSSWSVSPAAEASSALHPSKGQRVISMLFADAVGFSKLPDESIPTFVERFLGAIASALQPYRESVLTTNTWGDGLYITFSSPESAALLALDLCDHLSKIDWTSHGLPASLSLRTALHCGPAHEVHDPITQQDIFIGAHVSRAARLEPVTPPGAVYASQSFAALCECERVSSFACEYVGRLPLAKKYGEYRTYALRRR